MTSLYHVERDTCTVHGRSIKTRYFAIREGLTFYQTRSNAIILQGTLPVYCIPKVERLKTGEVLYERPYLSPRPPPKISLRHDHDWTRGNDQGSTVEHPPVRKLVQQSLGEALQPGSSKPTQFPKPIEDRTVQPVTQEIVGKLQEELSSSDRPGKPETKEEQHVRNHDGSGKPDGEEKLHKVQEDCHFKNRDDADKFNLAMDDENIDFNFSGIPDATVKRSTITIGPEGMINWVLQLNNSQLGNSFNSLLEKFRVLNYPNQPNPNPNQSVMDRRNLRTQNVFLWMKEKRPVPTRSTKNVCTKNLALQIDRRNLIDCLKTFVLSMLTMEQENLWSQAAQAHT